MIAVTVGLSQDGLIRHLHCTGHAGFALKGSDIVCAAFTVLVRTWARTCENSPEVEFQVLADADGVFTMEVQLKPQASLDSHRATCWFLLRGLDDLVGEYPAQISITYSPASGR